MSGAPRVRYRSPVPTASKSSSSLARRTASALRKHAKTIGLQRDALEKRELALRHLVDRLRQEARAASGEQAKVAELRSQERTRGRRGD